MKAYQIGGRTGLSSLTCVDKPEPVCEPGQAVRRVSAVCLNHHDLKVLAGKYGPRRQAGRTPGSDGVGEVIAVGAGAGHHAFRILISPGPGSRNGTLTTSAALLSESANRSSRMAR